MSVLDVAPQEYKIDNVLYVEPVGVTGRHVTGQFLNIVARASLKKNLEHSFEQAKVEIADDLLVAPIALAKAVLTENEMRSGCALVDFGADTTTVLVYKNNILRYLSVLPLGGNNITRDITSLQMEEEDAEKLKLQYGDALYEEEDAETPAACTLEDGRTFELAMLNNIIGARAEEILANVWNQIQLSGYEKDIYSGVVFTGGCSNLKNLEAAFRKQSKMEKVKTNRFIHATVHGMGDNLKKDGTQCTLLALLQAGKENCCKPEKKPILENPGNPKDTQTVIGFDIDKSNTTIKKPEGPKPPQETTRTGGKPTPPPQKPKPNKFWGLFDRIQEEILGEGEKM